MTPSGSCDDDTRVRRLPSDTQASGCASTQRCPTPSGQTLTQSCQLVVERLRHRVTEIGEKLRGEIAFVEPGLWLNRKQLMNLVITDVETINIDAAFDWRESQWGLSRFC